MNYSKTCLKRPLKKKTKIGFQARLLLICRSKVLQNAPREHSAILSAFIKLPFVFKIFVLSIFEWPLKTGFTVHCNMLEFTKRYNVLLGNNEVILYSNEDLYTVWHYIFMEYFHYIVTHWNGIYNLLL